MADASEIAAGGPKLRTRVKAASVRPIHNRVIVSGMDFGEQTTKGGIILTSDDGKDRGIKPRWGKVVSKGPSNNDPYEIGDYILVEHGRWTRGYDLDTGSGDVETLRTVEAESILGWQSEPPEDIHFGSFSGAGSTDSHRPEDFVN